MHRIWGEIKARLERGIGEWGVFAAIVLVGLTAFGLGRLSALEQVRPAVTIERAPVATGTRQMAVGGLYVASKSGSVYYFPWCAGAQKISQENERWFTDEPSAVAAGYRPAKNCAGLAGQ